MRTLFLLPVLGLLTACDFTLGEVCFNGEGYQPGITPTGAIDLGENDQPTLSGTHDAVKPILIAAGAKEGLLATVPVSTPGAGSTLTLGAAGDLTFVEPIATQCGQNNATLIKGRFQASMGPGLGDVIVSSGNKTVTHFPIQIVPATALEILPPEKPIVVNKPITICAVATSASGKFLYADDSLAMTVDGPGQLALLDPGGACRELTAGAPGKLTVTVKGLGLTTNATFESIGGP